jgi:hypothetical protein
MGSDDHRCIFPSGGRHAANRIDAREPPDVRGGGLKRDGESIDVCLEERLKPMGRSYPIFVSSSFKRYSAGPLTSEERSLEIEVVHREICEYEQSQKRGEAGSCKLYLLTTKDTKCTKTQTASPWVVSAFARNINQWRKIFLRIENSARKKVTDSPVLALRRPRRRCMLLPSR